MRLRDLSSVSAVLNTAVAATLLDRFGRQPATNAIRAVLDDTREALQGGATLAQIMKATDWQAHSVRGFISGALGKKMGLTVDSIRREDGERVYSIG